DKPEEEIINEVVSETASPVNSEVVSDVVIETDVTVETDVSVEESEDVVGDPSEDEIADADDEAAPSLMGIKGRFSAKNGVGSGFRGGFGKIGRGLRGMIGGGGGGGGSRGLCLVWLLDQSGSMKDDQEALAKQARDIQDLLTDGGRKKMLSGVVTFGQNWAITQPLTSKASRITDAILNVEIDKSGVENTNQAIIYACEEIMAKKRGWTKVIVLLSDESSSDQRGRYSGKKVEEEVKLKLNGLSSKAPLLDLAVATLAKTKTRLFVIGKESPFQQKSVWEPYVDDEGKRWVLSASRGPETPEMEVPLANAVVMSHHNRGRMVDNYVKAGYGVYDMAYPAKASRGAYFILDTSDGAAKRPLSASERARFPFKMCWGVMDKYKPLVVARSDYKNALFKSGKQGKKLWQLNEFFRTTKGISRTTGCAPTTQSYTKARDALRKRSELIVKVIKAIGNAKATDEEIRKAKDLRQIANIDIYYSILLADQIITNAWLDAFERYKGPLDVKVEEGWWHRCGIRPLGDDASPEDKALFDERMVELAQACNEVIRRHSNTPYALAARWLQQGPREWGKPYMGQALHPQVSQGQTWKTQPEPQEDAAVLGGASFSPSVMIWALRVAGVFSEF
ncbi:MAG: vWA domain-containing protein, partial [Planctomycetota bacterium]